MMLVVFFECRRGVFAFVTWKMLRKVHKTSGCIHIYLSKAGSKSTREMAAEVLTAAFAAAHRALSSSDEPHPPPPPPPPGPEGDSSAWPTAGADESSFEYWMDGLLGLAFLITTLISAKRMAWSRQQGGAETTVVTAFYSLILMTSVLRAVWFLVPNSVFQPSYTPVAYMAFDPEHPSWVGAFISELLLTAGSLCLFSIFILILVYWADILKKYFYPGARRTKPMVTFLTLVGCLVLVEILNAAFFLAQIYSSEGMILVNALLLATVSIVCVCEITIFSHRFRTVLKTLGAINQVSTESQVKRIVWITVTGNLFFFTRAFLEAIFAILLIIYWHRTGTVAEVFSHELWDTYILLKHWSEVAILCLMLYILQSRFTANASGVAAGAGGRAGYDQVPDNEAGAEAKETGALNV